MTSHYRTQPNSMLEPTCDRSAKPPSVKLRLEKLAPRSTVWRRSTWSLVSSGRSGSRQLQQP